MVLAHDINTVERTQDVQIAVDVTFGSMLLKKETLQGLETSGFYKPSPIQLHGIPLGKCGFDLFLEAKSGTGKTAVFTVIALEKLDLCKDLQCIILTPTREIAAQICDVIKQIGSMYNDLNVEVVMGGLPIEEDILKFKNKVHLLVGSPGRMRHLIQDKHIDVSAVRLLVLDEADKLMDKSFQSDINYIFSVLPKQKQVIMSSATYPEALKSVMQNYVQKVQHICPESTAVLLGINQLITTVESHPNVVRQTQIKFKELVNILTHREFKQCLIFCNYQIRVVELCKMLLGAKWPAEQLHAQLEQSDRLDALKTLQEYKCRILVSTDLAARGIDASNVDLVINFEPAYDWQTYLHRMGRAGRFGAYGTVITILNAGKELTKFKEIMSGYISSLNLINMQDNNKFELDETDTHCSSLESMHDTEVETASTITEEQKLHEDCAVLLENTEFVKDECNIESFAMLTESFEKSKECKIESFTDLMASLQVHEESDQDGNEIADIHFKLYRDFVTSLKAKPKTVLRDQSSSDIDLELEIGNKNHNTSKVHSKPTVNMPHSNINLTHIKSISSDDEKYMNLIHPDKVISDSQRALADAGLPTAFGSTKFQQEYGKTSIRRRSKKLRKFNNLKQEESSTNMSKENQTYSNLPNIPTNQSDTQTLNLKNNNRNKTKQSKNYDEINMQAQEKYLVWYNQLKNHVKSVEMSLYIRELSEM